MTNKAALRFSLLVGTALISSHAWAGLGKINVRSSLGEPFRAEIPLTAVTPADLDSTKVGLADADTFRQFQIDYASVLSALRFALVQGSNGAFIRVTSSQPISEPFLRFVIEARNNTGRSVREYTVLLDPPEYNARPVEVNQAETVQELPKYADDNLASRFRGHVSGTPSAGAARPSELVAGPGNSLRGLAARVRPHGATLTQTMAALVQANPDAFIDDNPQLLKSGAHLKVPSVAAIRAIGNAEARQILAAGQPAPGVMAENGATGSAITRQPPQPAGIGKSLPPSAGMAGKPAGGNGVLKLTPAESPAGTDVKLNELETQVAARDKSLKDAEQRIATLEAQVAALKGVPVPAPVPGAVVPASAPLAAASAPVAKPASAPAVRPQPKPVAPVHAAPKPEEVPPPGLMTRLLARVMDKLPLIGGGVIALLLLGLLAVRIRQRRRGPAVAGMAAAVGVGAGAAAAAASSGMLSSATQGMAGGHSFMSDFTRSFGEIDAGEVDPVAEAEVYIAYGRDEQAEEILKDALVRDPARHEVRMKLLEIYMARQDKANFERIARELHAAFDGKGQLWSKAATMGQALDPGNPLYELKESAPIASVAAPAAPIDLDQELMSIQQPATPAPSTPPADLLAELEAPLRNEPEPAADDDALRSALFGEEAAEPAEPVAAPAENLLDFDLDSLTQEPAAQPKPEPASAPAPAAENLLDFDFPVEDLNKEAASVAPAKPAELPVEEPLGDFASLYDAEPEKPLDTSGITVSDDPLSTKLDLAKVYLDMGDSDGAREVLKELLEEAQGPLKDEAQALLSKLGG